MFFGLSDVLADDAPQVDLVEVQTDFRRDDADGHRLAGKCAFR